MLDADLGFVSLDVMFLDDCWTIDSIGQPPLTRFLEE